MTEFSSFFGYAVRMPETALQEDEPVSVYRAEMTRNMLGHMLDEYCQHRINWVPSSTDDLIIFNTNEQRIWHQTFPLTWLRSDRPCNLDLRIAGLTSGGTTPTTDFRARIVPAKFAVGDDAADDLALIDETVTITSAILDWIIDVQTDFGADGVPKGFGGSAWDSTILVSEGEVTLATVSLMRLEIIVDEQTSVSDPAHIIGGVLLREFAG